MIYDVLFIIFYNIYKDRIHIYIDQNAIQFFSGVVEKNGRTQRNKWVRRIYLPYT